MSEEQLQTFKRWSKPREEQLTSLFQAGLTVLQTMPERFSLTVVRQRREDAVLSRLDGDLQIRVGIEEHSLLQTHGLNA